MSKKLQFRKFTEINDWEGEEWNFWLQVDGNEAELERLAEYLADDEEFQLSSELATAKEVKTLVKHAHIGYMADENKVTGRLKLPENLHDDDHEYPSDWFYKGGIVEFFQ